MPTDPSVDNEEQLLAFLREDTSLEDACEAPGFSLIVWNGTQPQVFDNWFSPIFLGACWPNNHYLCLRLSHV
jgi:hypothetical protein